MSLELIRFDNYWGVWSIAESHAEAFQAECEATLSTFRAMPAASLEKLLAARTESVRDAAKAGYELTGDGVAVFRLEGTMTKRGSSLSTSGSMARLQSAMRSGRKDAAVRAGLLVMDSPGGSIHGLESLAEEWAAFGAAKPTSGLIEDMGCSACYWAISQSQTLAATPGAIVGSIGVFQTVMDYSAAAAKDGVKVHVIRSGQFKGAGTPGTEVTPEQIAEWQRQCDEIYGSFVKAIQKTGRMTAEQAAAIADGRVYSAESAVGKQLIDQVATFDQVYSQLVARLPAPAGKERKMAAASFQEIVADCKGCAPSTKGDDAMFVADCQAKGLEVAAAQSAWMDTLAARADLREKEAEEAKAALKAKEDAPAPKAGTPTQAVPRGTVTDPASAGGTATQRWSALVAALPKGDERQSALSRLISENKQLHKDYLADHNARNPHHVESEE